MSEEEIAGIGLVRCQKVAPFASELGFSSNSSAFSSSVKSEKGIVLVAFSDKQTDSTYSRIWKDSTWSAFGYMGAITTDDKGNVYSAPVPHISTANTSLSEMNRVYRIDATTGKMKLFSELPAADTSSAVVPFAVLGVYFDCHAKRLYVSSVAGSTRESVRGSIYVVDIQTGEILDHLDGHDAIGVFVAGVTGEKRLFFGDARSSFIKSIALNREGRFSGKVREEFSLSGLGARGDDKGRRIRLDHNGNMVVYGVEFNYSLAPHGDMADQPFLFQFDRQGEKWIHLR